MTEEETATITRLAKVLNAAQDRFDYYFSMDRTQDNAVSLELARTDLEIAQQKLRLARAEIVQRWAPAS